MREVMRLSTWVESGNLAAVVSDETPGVVVEGLEIYWRSVMAVLAEERRIVDEDRKRNAKR